MNTIGKLDGTAKMYFGNDKTVVNRNDVLEITVDIDDMSTTNLWINNEIAVKDTDFGERSFSLKQGDEIRIKTRCGETHAEICYIEGGSAILHNVRFRGAYNAFGQSAIGGFTTDRLDGDILTSGWVGPISLRLYRTAREMARLTSGKPWLVRIYDALAWLINNGAQASWPTLSQEEITEDEILKMEQYLGPSTVAKLTTVGDADPYADYEDELTTDKDDDYADFVDED